MRPFALSEIEDSDVSIREQMLQYQELQNGSWREVIHGRIVPHVVVRGHPASYRREDIGHGALIQHQHETSRLAFGGAADCCVTKVLVRGQARVEEARLIGVRAKCAGKYKELSHLAL